MDGLGVESCPSPQSSSSLKGLNLICSNNQIERRPPDSSNSSETSISPVPSNTDFSKRCVSEYSEDSDYFLTKKVFWSRLSVNESNKDDANWENRQYNNDAAKRSRERRRMNDMTMEQKLLELTKENNLLRSRLKQQQQQQQQQQAIRLVTSASHDSVIVSTSQRKDTIASVVPTVPSLPVSSVTTLAANLANVIGPPTKLPAMFPTHLFTTAPLLATPSSSAPPPIFPPSGTAATPLLTSATTAPQVAVSATQQLPALQICTLQAALQQVQQAATISSGHGAFQPFHSSRDPTSSTQSYSPDSSTNDATPVDYSLHGTIHIETPSDPSHILRYRLLERHLDVSTEAETEQHVPTDTLAQSSSSSERARESDLDDKPRSLLGSLLSTKRTSPLVAQSRTDTHSGLNNASPKDNDLKNCLSSLAVNLSNAMPGTRTTVSGVPSKPVIIGSMAISGASAIKSDSSDSMESPTSNNSTTDSMRSQLSPSTPKNSAIVKALRSKPSSKQQYIDRRRRNNEAAKRCRANRRAQFEYRSKRAQQLEAENDELRKEMNRLNQELEQLKALHAAKSATVLQR
uniref:BZIP domain-containing protein n=1 Tax=Setaria digitata TaxID=48799 RepID=A0A915PN12_9BILA